MTETAQIGPARLVPTQKRSRARFEAILETAEQILLEKGADAFRMSDIVARAGVPHGSLYQMLSGLQAPNEAELRRQAQALITKGRHDPCVGLRAAPIAEAMLALVLIDHALRNRGQNADVHSVTPVIPSHT